MSIRDKVFIEDYNSCLSVGVMGAFLKGLNLKMDCVTKHAKQTLGSQEVEGNKMNMLNYLLFLHVEKSHFFLMKK